MHLFAILVLLSINPPGIGSDQLTIGLKSFQTHLGAVLTESSDALIPNLLGTTQTFLTGLDAPLDQLWIHSTSDNQVFDITLADAGMTDLTQSDAYARLVLLRILWAGHTGDVQLFRAVMQSSGISVQSRSIMNEEQTVLALYGVISSGRTPIQVQDGATGGSLVASMDTGRNTFTISIIPTLNLVLNGDVNLFKLKLLRMLAQPMESTDIQLSMYHDVRDDEESRRVELPDFGLYYSRWSFDRVDGDLVLAESAFDSLATDEAWLPNHAAYWSTILFPDSLTFSGIHRSGDYQMVLSLAMETGHQSTFDNPQYLGPMLTFGSIRLPSYYVVSGVKRTGGSVEVEGYLMVFDPTLHYQHIFRITDVIQGDLPENMVWQESRVHAVLVMRSEQIQDLNSSYPSGDSGMPIFQLRIKP